MRAQLTDYEGGPAILNDSRIRRNVWQALTSASAARGSTYTFVSAGKADITAQEMRKDRSIFDSAAPPSLRHLLQRLDGQRSTTSTFASCAPQLPRNINLDLPRDPCAAGILTRNRAMQLIEYYNRYLAPWMAAIDPTFDASSFPFLFTTILYQASKYCDESRGEATALASHARMLAVLTFAEVDSKPESILAYYLFAAWKAPDDSISDVYTSYVDRARMRDMTIGNRHCERIQFFHYVQQSVYLLHYRSSSLQNKSNKFARQSLIWSQDSEALENDWFLCSDVESTAIQCRYKALFEEQHQQRHSGTCGAAFSSALFDAFLQDVDDWEHRWRREARQKSRNVGDNLRMIGFGLFRNSVCTQIGSIALYQALQSWVKDQSTASSAFLQKSFQVCLDSCLGVLDSILDPSNESNIMLHMPDSLVILIDQAALLAIYLLLLPTMMEASSVWSTSSLGPLNTISTSIAPDCIVKIKRVEAVLRVASYLRSSSLVTAVGLSADYLASLLNLVEGRVEEGQQSSTMITSTSNTAGATAPSYILDSAAATPFPSLEESLFSPEWLNLFSNLPTLDTFG